MHKVVTASRELTLANRLRRIIPDLLAASVPLVLDNFGWILDDTDLPVHPFWEDQVIRPPWDKVWVEMRFNRILLSGKRDLDHEEGWLIQRGRTGTSPPDEDGNTPTITEWCVDRYCLSSGDLGNTHGYVICTIADTGAYWSVGYRRGTEAEELHVEEDDWSHIVAVLLLPFMAFALIHSRCVEPLEVLPVLKRQQRRRSQRDHTPIIRYKILHVPTSNGPLSSSVHASIEDRFPIPLHLVRGHYARYTEKGPMFGRLVGTYYKRAHLRGRADAGAIAKTYDV